jgi:hypothetical protein
LDKTIVTTLLIIAGVVAAVTAFRAIYPAVVQSSQAITSMEGRLDERLKSQIQIIHAAPEGQINPQRMFIWVKNVGSESVKAVERCDVFFGPEGNFVSVPYGGSGTPNWEYEVENDTYWSPRATLKITIDYGQVIPDDRYFVKVTLPNGVSDEYFFSK